MKKSLFYIDSVEFYPGRLNVIMNSGVIIRFEYVRSFLVYKDSDMYEEFQKYRSSRIFSPEGERVGVFEIEEGSVLTRVIPSVVSSEGAKCYWIVTADECVEVLAFDKPTVEHNK